MGYFIRATLLVIAASACSSSERTDIASRAHTQRAIATRAPQDTSAPRRAQSTPSEPLDSQDFVVAGIAAGTDTTTVLARFGRPDSIGRDPNRFEPGTELITWYYHDMILGMGYGAAVGGVTLSTPTLATARGLRVGDTLERIRALYGEPRGSSKDSWYYLDPHDDSELHVIDIRLADGFVRSIFVGYWMD